MKKKSLILFTLLFVFSCTNLEDDLYDRIPDNLFPENIEQANGLTIPIYRKMTEMIDWGGWWFAQEITTDEMVCPTRDTDWDDGGKWRVLHQHTWTNTTEAIEAMWGRYYYAITEANKLLEQWEQLPPNERLDKSIAKLKTLRALYYYYLIDNYGDVPYITVFSTAPLMPRKSPRDSIFNAIVEDLTPIIHRIDNNPAAKYVVTRGMAYMLMAKLYLNAEVYTGTPQWFAAEQYCDSVLSMGYVLETNPLSPFVTENQNSPEIIFSIPFDEDLDKGFNLHMRTLHYNSNLTYNMPVGPWNGFATLKSHYDSYENNDRRKTGYFLVGEQRSHTGGTIRDAGAGNAILSFDPYIPALKMGQEYTKVQIRMSGARISKFEIKLGAKENLSNDFPIFRLADAMLMKAEALIRQGRNAEALPFVNPIRTRSSVTAYSAIDLEELLAERGREMFYEAHRRQDLIRFGKFNQAWWEKPASTPDRNVFPIPQWAISANPNLQ